jgi:hypothetical protein
MEILEHVPLSGPFGLEMKAVSTSSLLQLVEAALTHNTPVPLYSNATLLGAASDVRERIGTLENAIDTLQDFVKDLRDRKTEHVKLQHALERAGSRELDPFPPIPLDLAQKIIQEAASLDMATASNLCSVSKLVQTWFANFHSYQNQPIQLNSNLGLTSDCCKKFLYALRQSHCV